MCNGTQCPGRIVSPHAPLDLFVETGQRSLDGSSCSDRIALVALYLTAGLNPQVELQFLVDPIHLLVIPAKLIHIA